MKLADLPDEAVLGTWCTSIKGDEYTAIVRLAFASGLRITAEAAKSDIERRLHQQMLLPTGRPVTRADLRRAQMVWLADHTQLFPDPTSNTSINNAISQKALPGT